MCKASPLGCFPIEQISPFPTAAWLWRICKAAARGLIPPDLPSGGCGVGVGGCKPLCGREGDTGRGERAVELGSRVLECKGEAWNFLGEAGKHTEP